MVKIRGDNQRARVQGFSGDRAPVSLGIRSAIAAPGDSLFPDPLVGVLVAVAAERSPVAPGLRANALPSNTVVRWDSDDPSIVRPFLPVTIPGAGDTIVNRGVRGTKAGRACLRTQTLVGSTPVSADSFCFTVDPGPPATFSAPSDTFLVVGSHTPLASLVRNAKDTYGNAVTSLDLSGTPSAGWTVSAGELVAPADERRGTLGIGAGTGSVSIGLVSIPDLASKHMRATFFCGPYLGSQPAQNGVPADSISADVAVDSVRFLGQPGFRTRLGGNVASLFWTGPVTYFLRDGTTTTRTLSAWQEIRGFAPDSLQYTTSNVPTANWGVETSGSPLHYTGGTWCLPLGVPPLPGDRSELFEVTP